MDTYCGKRMGQRSVPEHAFRLGVSVDQDMFLATERRPLGEKDRTRNHRRDSPKNTVRKRKFLTLIERFLVVLNGVPSTLCSFVVQVSTDLS
jgi:hypothetical protein